MNLKNSIDNKKRFYSTHFLNWTKNLIRAHIHIPFHSSQQHPSTPRLLTSQRQWSKPSYSFIRLPKSLADNTVQDTTTPQHDTLQHYTHTTRHTTFTTATSDMFNTTLRHTREPYMARHHATNDSLHPCPTRHVSPTHDTLYSPTTPNTFNTTPSPNLRHLFPN